MSKEIFMEQDEYQEYLKNKNQKKDESKPVAQMTLYQFNQNIMSSQPALSGDGVRKGQLEFFDWISKQPDTPKFYMLLCSELNYYTVFHINDKATKEDFWNELYDIAKELGTLKAMEIDSGCFSIWADWPQDNISHLFYLFPYDRGVVEV